MNQELLAIGVTNIMGSFVSGYPVTGSFGRCVCVSVWVCWLREDVLYFQYFHSPFNYCCSNTQSLHVFCTHSREKAFVFSLNDCVNAQHDCQIIIHLD